MRIEAIDAETGEVVVGNGFAPADSEFSDNTTERLAYLFTDSVV